MTSTPTSEAPASRSTLLRILGVGFGLAIVVGNTIGAGIMATPGEVAARLPHPGLFIGLWIAGGIYALLGTMQMIELTCMIRRSGGQFTFARRALGEFPGFFVGWSDFVSTSGTTALVSFVIAEYSGVLLPALVGHEKAVATAVVLVFGAIQWRGTRSGADTQNITTAAKGLAFVLLVLACFVFGSRGEASAATAPPMPTGTGLIVALVFALQSVIYTYDGWTGVSYVAEEVTDPDRNIPRSMFGGVLSVMGIYLLVNVALIWLLPISAIANNSFALGAAAQAVFGPMGDTVIRTIMIVSMLSGINAYHFMTTRVLFSMSRDGYFPEWIVRVNAGGTPTRALALSLATALALIWTGTFRTALSLCALLFVLQYVVSFISLIVLRRREPGTPRPYKAWAYPWSTGIVLLGSIGFVIGVIIADWKNSLYSLILLALSYPVFRLLRRPATSS